MMHDHDVWLYFIQNFIAPCCWRSYKTYENDQETLKVLEKALGEQPQDVTNKQSAVCDKVTCRWRLKIWTFMDNPFLSKAAQVSHFSTSKASGKSIKFS